MIISKAPQGSEEWERVRKGKATGSEMAKILTPSKLDFASGARQYACQKVAEILGVESPQPAPNFWMERGTELEPEARLAFEEYTQLKVDQVGFIMPHKDARYGCSVDGIIIDERNLRAGILEIKCPSAEVLIGYHDSDEIPKDYMMQIQFNMFVCEVSLCWFWAWHPYLNPMLKLVQADERYQSKFGPALEKFNEMVDSILAKVQKVDRPLTQYQGEEYQL